MYIKNYIKFKSYLEDKKLSRRQEPSAHQIKN